MNKIMSILLLLVWAIVPISCSGKKSSSEREIYISGSTTVAYIMAEIATAFEEAYPQYKIIIEGVGSTAGVEDTSSRENHIGMSSRSISDDERDDVEPFLLCKDALVLIVNKEADLDKISKEELSALYIDNAQVLDISRAVSRMERATTRVAFTESTGIGQREELHSTVEIVGSTTSVKEAVIEDKSKLGYVSLGLLDDRVKVLAYGDGERYFEPSVENIQSGHYSIYRPFYLVVKKSALTGGIQIFLDFCRSAAAREIMLQNGLIPPSN